MYSSGPGMRNFRPATSSSLSIRSAMRAACGFLRNAAADAGTCLLPLSNSAAKSRLERGLSCDLRCESASNAATGSRNEKLPGSFGRAIVSGPAIWFRAVEKRNCHASSDSAVSTAAASSPRLLSSINRPKPVPSHAPAKVFSHSRSLRPRWPTRPKGGGASGASHNCLARPASPRRSNNAIETGTMRTAPNSIVSQKAASGCRGSFPAQIGSVHGVVLAISRTSLSRSAFAPTL